MSRVMLQGNPSHNRFGVKVIHKDLSATADVVSAFCLSSIHETNIALATQKEIIELDVSQVLWPPSWLEDTDSEDDCGG